jgi:hypothetical protein
MTSKRAVLVLSVIFLAEVISATLHIVVGPPPATRPVHRYYNNRMGTHVYTIDPAEKAKLDEQYSHVWIYEGVAFYAWPDPNSMTPQEPGI